MSKKAVWLSDIEFIEMHSSDWERLESEAFEPDESVQAQLNESQQIVLDWLKSDDHPNYSNIFDLFSDLLEYQVPTKVGEAFTEMMTDKKQQIQVLQAFSCWAIEQEEE